MSMSEERLEFVTPILDYHDLQYTIFPAHKQYDEELNHTFTEIQSLHPELDQSDPYVAGRVGCWASHRAVWRDAQSQGYSNFLVLKDDVDIDLELRHRVARALQEVPYDWDMLFLGHCYASLTGDVFGEFIRKTNYTACTHAYAFKTSIVPKTLEWSKDPSFVPVDLAAIAEPLKEGMAGGFLILPQIIAQRPLRADRSSSILDPDEVNWDSETGLAMGNFRVHDTIPKQLSTAYALDLAYWFI